MKKQLALICTAFLVSVLFGWWMRTRMSIPFTGFSGQYQCSDFGIPDKNYNILRFQTVGDRILLDGINKSETSSIGRVDVRSSSLAVLDMDPSLAHQPTLTLNPLAEHFIEGKRDTIIVVGRQEGKELYRYSCQKVPGS